ncbi:EAL domain-containing protein [Klebsiella pneumoniae]|nr:EAL domain-containing protein [Klebsiella pneumoniae]
MQRKILKNGLTLKEESVIYATSRQGAKARRNPHIEWLTVLDFDEIKIDRIFIANIDDPVKRALLVSMVKGLRGTGKPLVFEGVETPGQFEFACSLGPGYLVQGWYTGKPETISAMNIQG